MDAPTDSNAVAAARFAFPQELLEDVSCRWLEAMRRGDFESAWRETDRIESARRALGSSASRAAPCCLLWDGTPFDGRHVVVRCNHGLGDTIQFARFVPLVARRALSATLMVQPPLLDLLSRASELGHVVNGWGEHALPRDAVEIEVMELAYACRVRTSTLPPEDYLPIAYAHAQRARLAPHMESPHYRVGLLWTPSDWDTSRSIPVSALEPLAALRDVAFFSLQQGEAANAWRNAPFPLRPLSLHTAEITAAAAAILELDLVITVDAMVAHLAGALGRPVWVLLKHDCDWRWMHTRADSPWYRSMRLFRQPAAGEWDAVGAAVAHALNAELTRERARPLTSLTWAQSLPTSTILREAGAMSNCSSASSDMPR